MLYVELWPLCFGAVVDYVSHCLQKPSFMHILNNEISQFPQHLGAPPDPRIWDCLLGETRTPF